MRWRVVAVALFALPVAACVHRASSEQAQPALISVITRADLERIHARTALDAVQRLRSDALTARAPSSVLLNKHIHPVVFLNDQYLGAVDELQHYPADSIEEIRILSGPDAVTRFGSQYGGGVIQIIARIS